MRMLCTKSSRSISILHARSFRHRHCTTHAVKSWLWLTVAQSIHSIHLLMYELSIAAKLSETRHGTLRNACT